MGDIQPDDPATGRASRRRRRRIVVAVVVGLIGLLAAARIVGGMWSAHEDPRPPTASPSAPAPIGGTVRAYPSFSPDSPLTTRVDDAEVDPRSAQMVEHLRGQIEPHWSGVAALNVSQYSASLYVVDEDTPRQRVEFDDCQDKGAVPDGLYDGPGHFLDVPVPPEALVAPGEDQALSLWSPSTDQLWEFWKAEKKDGRWQACWGGRIDGVSTDPGRFPHPFGATATGIPMVGTMLTVQDVAGGRAEHALGLVLIKPADHTRFRYPANRSDGPDPSPDAIPEGARLRLDPSVDVDALDLTPVGRIIATAAQRYGFIVVDKAGAVGVVGESGLPERQLTGSDPWDTLLTGPDHDQLRNFPWDRVQVLRDGAGVPDGQGDDGGSGAASASADDAGR